MTQPVEWRNHRGARLMTTADFDVDGDVDITDFNSLATNFAAKGYGATNAVPEPGVFLLARIGIAVMSCSYPRR